VKDMAYCPKCGTKVAADAEFCKKCGHGLKGKDAEALGRSEQWEKGMEEKFEKHEKYEKHEKHEKHEKSGKYEKGGEKFGPFMGGFILIWVGICLYLAYFNHIDWSIFWAYIVTGIGVILLVVGVLVARFPDERSNPRGMLLGGVVMLVLGVVSIALWHGARIDFWASFWSSFWIFIPIIIGIMIIIGGLTARRRSPRP